MKVSDNFSRKEFACKCNCGFASVDVELVKILEETRSYFTNKYSDRKISISITSGNRCEFHNKNEGGASGSYHLKGMAADFRVNNVHADEVSEYLCNTYPDRYGIGKYQGRTHLDVRESKARWDLR